MDESPATELHLDRCLLPDRTELQEHTLVTDRMVLVGDRARIDYGISGAEVMVAEFCRINGALTAKGDIRIDNWTEVTGNVATSADAYLGEGVRIAGRLSVAGDLDIGDNVQIEQGFEAHGWIQIRNPLPVIVYIMLYLMAMLRFEREEEVERFMAEVLGEEEGPVEPPLVIPTGAVFDTERLEVPGEMAIGSHCRLHGNVRARTVEIGTATTLFGSVRASERVVIGPETVVHGTVSCGGPITVGPGAHVLGDLDAGTIEVHERALVDGTMRAPKGLRIVRDT
ncbi:MAG TPA: polymer-forming cytoskeletal protein [Methanoregulaceae archaeon]|nr:polymer-forming cytoskeletal protein [Methanoregulaceae archaeon]HQJ88797.1 polymer-forming cytoskeletal protein [Methanoregulaceae archaeon]